LHFVPTVRYNKRVGSVVKGFEVNPHNGGHTKTETEKEVGNGKLSKIKIELQKFGFQNNKKT